MFTIPGYTINELIYENNKIRVYRGRDVQQCRPVIIKAIREEMATPDNLSKLIYEFEITRDLDIEGIVKPLCLKMTGSAAALIMEDAGAVSLREYLQTSRPDITEIFSISIQLTEALMNLHQKGVIHMDIKPDNIIIHPGSKQVKIIDFSMAVAINREGSNYHIPNTSAGTPAYASPEQADRMNKTIDFRSDLYSLGVIFYEILSGQLPLQAVEPDGWLYTHIAQKPVPLGEINAGIPQMISAIIMKLLARNAGERYQCASTLLWDLEECRKQWSKTGMIELFLPGQMDSLGHFQLSRKLYGREKEREALEAAFQRICSGCSELLLVSGYAGTGKTFLINGTFKSLLVEKGYYAAGKFDQLMWCEPYVPFIQAFRELIRQILTESRESFADWKKKLLKALGRNGAVITEVISEVELIIGTQPPVELLKPQEAQNRFRIVFGKFVRVFAAKNHPLVIFLDDLQWADPATLQLVRYLIDSPDDRYLLIIGAYRDNEVEESHPLMKTLAEIQKAGNIVGHISLAASLNIIDAGKFIADSLNITEKEVQPLTEIFLRKTAGNPFFLTQLLKSVYDEKLMSFNKGKGCWEWEPESLENLTIKSDVIDFMMERLMKLPEDTRNILKLSACIGNSFDIKTLAMICEKKLGDAVSDLWPAVEAGIVLALDHTAVLSHAAGKPDMSDSVKGHKMMYEFLHDRVQQAAYSLVPEKDRKEIHLKIGGLILKSMVHNGLEEIIFTITDHFNRGMDLIEKRDDRFKLLEYNLIAGRKAKASTAYDSALSYFKSAIELLPDNSWDEHYRITYELHMECSQCQYLCAYFDEAERLFDLILSRVKTDMERAEIYGLKMVLFSGAGNYLEAAQLGMTALGCLGMSLPEKPGKIDFLKEFLLSKCYLKNKKVENLFHLQEMSDPVYKKVLELLILLAPSLNMVNPELFAFVNLKAGSLSMKYGNTELSSVAYAGFSLFTGSVLGDYRTGYEFEKMALKLSEKYNNSYAKCIVYLVLGAFTSHWTKHGKTGIGYLKMVVRYGFEAGELLFSGYALTCILENKYLLGVDLKEVYEDCQNYNDFAVRMKQDTLLKNTIIYKELILYLKGLAKEPLAFDSGDYDDGDIFEKLMESKETFVTYHVLKTQLHYLYGDYADALNAADKAQKDVSVIMGYVLSAEHVFYHSLAITAVYHQLTGKQKRKYRKVLKKNQNMMKKWADSCPENFLHKYLLVAAEIARLGGKGLEAMSLYDQSIRSAHENGFIQNEAVAGEAAGRYYLITERDKIARTYMTEAFQGYCRWGAAGKAKAMLKQYPRLLEGLVVEENSDVFAERLKSIPSFSSSGDDKSSGEADAGIIRKAAYNIGKETDPGKALESFLEMAVENVGADKGYLILEKSGQLYVEALIEEGRQPSVPEKPLDMEECTGLSPTVVRYVARTLETVALNDGDQAGIFARDEYIMNHRPKSIVCIPVMLQGVSAGVLYMENSLMPGVFTPDRLELLKLLSTQMVSVKKLQAFLEKDEMVRIGETPQSLIESFTERELEVLGLIADGLSNREIAEKLEVSPNTVKVHVMNIYGKLGVNRRVQAVTMAKKLELIKTGNLHKTL